MQRRMDLYYAGAWHDVTSDTLKREGCTVVRGRPDEASTVESGELAFSLRDRERNGKWAPRVPTGPNYGLIGRNTPAREAMVDTASWLAVRGSSYGARVLHVGALAITGDIDIRVDARLVNWTTYSEAATVQLIGMGEIISDDRSWALMLRNGRLRLEWSSDGTTAANRAADATADLPVPASGRLSVRATLDVDNGAGGCTATFYTSTTAGVAGAWTQLGATVVAAGTTSISGGFGAADLLLGGGYRDYPALFPRGAIYGAEIRSGIGGTVKANPAFTAMTPGTTTWTDGAGRDWIIGSAGDITNASIRATGEIPSWDLKWHKSGQDVYAPVTAAGILRRLGQGNAPIASALRRQIPTDIDLLAYWPFEDAEGSGSAAPVTPNTGPAYTWGATFGADDSLAGSGSLASFDVGGRIYAPVPAYTGSATWQVEMVYKATTTPTAATEPLIFQVQASGAVRTWRVNADAGIVRVTGLDGGGATVVSSTSTPAGFYTGWGRLRLSISTSGGNTAWALTWVAIGVAAWGISGTATGLPGNVTAFDTTFGEFGGLIVGHLSATRTSTFSYYTSADAGWIGETAGARVTRLCTEQGVPIYTVGVNARQVVMGAQRQASFTELLSECVAADLGVLSEQRGQVGLAWRGHDVLLGAGPALVIDYGQLSNLEPVPDDQTVRNDVTASRQGGSSARSIVTTGPLGTATVGLYDEAITVNVLADSQLGDAASWRTRMGTWDESRFPVVEFKVNKLPVEIVRLIVLLDIGDRIRITNPPTWLGPDPIDLVIQHMEEEIEPDGGPWILTLTCTPARPWDVAVLDHSEFGRLDTDGATLQLAADATQTVLWVDSSPGPAWVSGDACLNPNPSFEVDTAGWTAFGAALTRDGTLALGGGWSGKIVPDGVSVFSGIVSDSIGIGAGFTYRLSGWLHCAFTHSISLKVGWKDNAGADISGVDNFVTCPAGVWTYVNVQLASPATAAAAVIAVVTVDTAPASHVIHADGLRLATTGGNLDALLNGNPGFDANLNGWAGSGGTLTRDTTVYKVGGASAKLVPDGVSQFPSIQSAFISARPGTLLRASAWMRCAVARTVDLNVNWHNSQTAYLSTSTVSVVVAANTWTFASGLVTPDAAAGFAVLAPTVAPFPPGSNILWADDVRLAIPEDGGQFPFDVLLGGERISVTAIDDRTSPQRLTVVRSVNGVAKAQTAGTVIALKQPAYVAY